MSDSVGKISLDLEIQSDISKQISSVSKMIGNNLKKSLSSGMKGALENVNSSTKKTMNSVTSNINSSMKKSMSNIAKTMKSILGNIKVPKIEIPKPTSFVTPKTESSKNTSSKRGPPINKEVLSSEILNVTATLDNVNAKIEQQRAKLVQLKEAYNSTFNTSRKNALEEKILKTEANINKLIGQSDKLGFKLADLDDKMAMLGRNASNANTNLNNTNNISNKTSKSINKLSNGIKRNSGASRSFSSGIGMIARSMFTWGIMFPMILRGLTSMATRLLNNLKTNEQFSSSLAQVKSNLMIAFTPIYEAILPAINALMSALSIATQYIASFISAIFGKTFEQSKQATQGLINAKSAMGAYGDSAKAAGKAAKDALGLASFDEINSLNSQNSNSGGAGGGGADIPTLVTPQLETSSVDGAMKKLVDKIKSYFNTFNFEPLIQSFNKVKSSVEPIINNLGKIIKWFFVEILNPLAHWTISDLLPAFLNLLAGALDFLNPILEVFMSLGDWLWNSFLQPIASWTGGIIVDVLNGLADVLTNIGNWISEHKPIVETFIIILGSFALAWGIVTTAIKIWTIVSGIATIATGTLGATVAFLTSPITLAVIAIGALIAIGVLLYKHWDVVKAKAVEVWDGIKVKFEEFKNWLGNVFSTDWSQKFGFLGDILNGFLVNIKNKWDSIKQIFQGIIDFVAGVFTGNWSRAWQGVVNIFSGIIGTLGAIVKSPLNAVISLINAAISGLNRISINIPNWIPGFGGKSFGLNIPKIPYLARGGIIDSPTLAMVGEAGKEAVVPLENNTEGLDLLAKKLLEKLGGVNTTNSSDGYGDGNIIFQIDGSTIGKVALKQLRKMQRQGNITVIPT
ncbi:MAG: hypothetical protein SOV85_13635 [Clostridium sp.]|uniref:hypothetical protein n=1 Tax=Clostridium sp. TaxID=1506 RepID=UPI002A75D0AB|nr:hypothetical protein [Clostridium sp.]MDY2632373.1 hypothetical protein [Clostridium sp.]